MSKTLNPCNLKVLSSKTGKQTTVVKPRKYSYHTCLTIYFTLKADLRKMFQHVLKKHSLKL